MSDFENKVSEGVWQISLIFELISLSFKKKKRDLFILTCLVESSSEASSAGLAYVGRAFITILTLTRLLAYSGFLCFYASVRGN